MEARNIAFYKFIDISDPQSVCAALNEKARQLRLLGTILIASEGINGMISGAPREVEKFENEIREISFFKDLHFKISYSDKVPFRRLMIKVKKEILTLGLKNISPSRNGLNILNQMSSIRLFQAARKLHSLIYEMILNLNTVLLKEL